VEGSEFQLSADTVIAAIAQVPVLDGLESLDHEGSWLVPNPDGTLGEGVLAGGDAIHPGIAGEAIVQGRRAAEALHARLRGLDPGLSADPEFPEIDPDHIRFASKAESEAVHMSTLPAEERVAAGMVEVAETITESQFLAEVERCFSCGTCSGCEQCFMYCTSGCFTRLEEPRPGMYFTLNLDQCKECGKCIEVCPGGFLQVIADAQRTPVG
jgi:Pyruvate/2-oxoacid:ferredoxin oxidoreductase delta subunit